MRALLLSIDLDSPTEYAAIHGVSLPAEDPHLMYRGPLDRFVDLCQSLGGPGTIFAIARDICGPAAARLKALDKEGYEIACHSHDHDYGLSTRQPGYILNDLRRAKHVFREQLGLNPLGFRAPGYALSPALMDEIEGQGFLYDSSVLPSPPYYLAKLAVLAGYRLRRRPSRAIVGSSLALSAPQTPYRPGSDPHTKGSRKVVELPISTATAWRLPCTGAAWIRSPGWLRRRMLRSLARQDVVVLNLHGMDLLDPTQDSLPPSLARYQPELRVSLQDRLNALTELGRALTQDRPVMVGAEIARRVRI